MYFLIFCSSLCKVLPTEFHPEKKTCSSVPISGSDFILTKLPECYIHLLIKRDLLSVAVQLTDEVVKQNAICTT